VNGILRQQRLLNVWHSTKNASSTHPLTSGVRYSNHACVLMAGVLNTRCKILKLFYIDM